MMQGSQASPPPPVSSPYSKPGAMGFNAAHPANFGTPAQPAAANQPAPTASDQSDGQLPTKEAPAATDSNPQVPLSNGNKMEAFPAFPLNDANKAALYGSPASQGAVDVKPDQTSTFGPSTKVGGWDTSSDPDTDKGQGAYAPLKDGVSAAIGANKAAALGVSPGDQVKLTDAQGNTKIVSYDDKVAKYPDRIDLYSKNGPSSFVAVKAEKVEKKTAANALYPNQKPTT